MAEHDLINAAILIGLRSTDASKAVGGSLAGKMLPEDPTGPVSITIKHVRWLALAIGQ